MDKKEKEPKITIPHYSHSLFLSLYECENFDETNNEKKIKIALDQIQEREPKMTRERIERIERCGLDKADLKINREILLSVIPLQMDMCQIVCQSKKISMGKMFDTLYLMDIQINYNFGLVGNRKNSWQAEIMSSSVKALEHFLRMCKYLFELRLKKQHYVIMEREHRNEEKIAQKVGRTAVQRRLHLVGAQVLKQKKHEIEHIGNQIGYLKGQLKIDLGNLAKVNQRFGEPDDIRK